MYQELDVISLVFEKLTRQHHDCFYICQELFPANHTNVSTPWLFYKCYELLPANHTDVSKQYLFLQMTEVPSCRLHALSLIWTKNFSFWHHVFYVVSYLFVCCHKSDPLKQDFHMTTIPVNTTKWTYSPKTCDTRVQQIGNNGLDQSTSTSITLRSVYWPIWHHHPLYHNHKISHPENP